MKGLSPLALLAEAEFHPEGAGTDTYRLDPLADESSDLGPLFRLVRGGELEGRRILYIGLEERVPCLGSVRWWESSLRRGDGERPLIEAIGYTRLSGQLTLPLGRVDVTFWSPDNSLPERARPLSEHGTPGAWLPTVPVFERGLWRLAEVLAENLRDPEAPALFLDDGSVWLADDRLFLLNAGVFRAAGDESPAASNRDTLYAQGLRRLIHTYLHLLARQEGLGGDVREVIPDGFLDSFTTVRELRDVLERGGLSLDVKSHEFRHRVRLLAWLVAVPEPESRDQPAPAGLDSAAAAEQILADIDRLLTPCAAPASAARGVPADAALAVLEGAVRSWYDPRQRLAQARPALARLLADGQKCERYRQQARAHRRQNASLSATNEQLRRKLESRETRLRTMKQAVERFQAQVKQREQARKQQQEALEEALSTVEAERDRCGAALVRTDRQLRDGAREIMEQAHVLLSVRTAAFGADALLLLALRFAVAALVSGQGVVVPVETLTAGGLLVLMLRCLASPGRWLFGTDLIRLPDPSAPGAPVPLPERAGWLSRLTSGVLHYAPVAAACALANWCPGRAAAWADVRNGSLVRLTGPWALQLLAVLWTGLLLLTLLFRGLFPPEPSLSRGTTIVEGRLRLGHQRLCLDRVTAWRSPPRRPT
jgi:hypothetical protein